jgi:hypothetical protein
MVGGQPDGGQTAGAAPYPANCPWVGTYACPVAAAKSITRNTQTLTVDILAIPNSFPERSDVIYRPNLQLLELTSVIYQI